MAFNNAAGPRARAVLVVRVCTGHRAASAGRVQSAERPDPEAAEACRSRSSAEGLVLAAYVRRLGHGSRSPTPASSRRRKVICHVAGLGSTRLLNDRQAGPFHTEG